MYGDFVVTYEGGKLMGAYQSFKAELAHWQYNTFVWVSGGLIGRSFITFQLGPDAKVRKAEVENLAVFLADRSGSAP
jgi:hypothetical protein